MESNANRSGERRRVVSLAALIAAAVLILVACGSDASSDAGDEAAATAEPTPTDAVEAGEPAAEAEVTQDATAPTEDAEPESDAGTPERGGEILYGLSDNGTGFDTTAPLLPGAIRIVAALNDPLVVIDAAEQWRPFLAESLTPNDDATLWTIKMRPDVRFHDGEPVDAAAVKANLEAYRQSPTVGFGFADVDTIEVVDPLTLEITMRRPWASFPHHLVGQAGYMVSPSSLGTNDDFVGTGAFVLESWIPGDSARVVANPDYWRQDEGYPYLDAVNFKVIPETSTRRQALEAGDIDAYESPSASDIRDFQETDETDVHVSESEANEFLLVLNTTAPPTDDLRVRTALAMAVDRQLLIDNFREGLTEPATSQISPAHRFWIDSGYPEFDLEGAADLIAEYEAENEPVRISITSVDEEVTSAMVDVIASFWRDAGVDVEIANIGQSAVAGTAIADDFDAIVWYQFASPDPDGDYVFFHSTGGLLNWSNLVDPEIDAALDLGRESADDAVRADAYAEYQERLATQVPMVWIDHLAGVEAVVADPSVRDIATGILPDGSQGAGLTFGSYHGYGQIWLASE